MLAAEWYDDRQEGLGEVFVTSVKLTLTTLHDPEIYPVVDGTPARSAPVKGFPYRVVFIRQGNELFVVSIRHDRQRPRYWSNRL